MELTKQEIEFLRESNKIEREYSEEALEDAKHSWNFAKRYRHNRIDIEFIKLIHQELMRRLKPRIAGKIRKCDVWIGGRKGYNSKEIELSLRDWCLGANNLISADEGTIEQDHIWFEKIHPFEDGNGRVGRILMNLQRLKLGLPLLIIHEGKEQIEYYKWFREEKEWNFKNI